MRPEQRAKRDAEITRAVHAGVKLTKLSAKYKLTATRIKQIVAEANGVRQRKTANKAK